MGKEYVHTFENFLNEGNDDKEKKFQEEMKYYKFKPETEKTAIVTKDFHGSEVRILTYDKEEGAIAGLVYYLGNWGYESWDESGKNRAGRETMADISKSDAQKAIRALS
jgi:hypothetical protein